MLHYGEQCNTNLLGGSLYLNKGTIETFARPILVSHGDVCA